MHLKKSIKIIDLVTHPFSSQNFNFSLDYFSNGAESVAFSSTVIHLLSNYLRSYSTDKSISVLSRNLSSLSVLHPRSCVFCSSLLPKTLLSVTHLQIFRSRPSHIHGLGLSYSNCFSLKIVALDQDQT